jgi:hypothetical protein
MNYVQVGILIALVLVAGLLGLNLIKDAQEPVKHDAATAVASEELEPTKTPPDTPIPSETQSHPESTAAKATEPVRHQKQPSKPVVPQRQEPVSKPVTVAASRPSPSASTQQTPTTTVSTSPAPDPNEGIRVDPPRAPSSSLPEPPVETASVRQEKDRYELMRPTPPVPAQKSVPESVEPPRTVTIPAGTILTVRTAQSLSSETAMKGDTFVATLDQPLVFEDLVIAERGSRAEGKVVDVDEGGRVKGVATISVQLTTINTSDGQTVPIQTQTFVLDAPKSVKGDAAKVGIATGIGAALGAIFGGGKGAAIGATVGAGAGTGTVLATKGKAAEIPSETRVNFRLDQPLHLTEKINQ